MGNRSTTRPPPYDGDKLRPPGPDEVWDHGVPMDSPLRLHSDWTEDPWAAPAIKTRRHRERHARWIAALTDRDWDRLAERADQVIAGQRFARFMDLDAPFDVAVCHPSDRMDTGDRFGVLRGCLLLAYRKGGR